VNAVNDRKLTVLMLFFVASCAYFTSVLKACTAQIEKNVDVLSLQTTLRIMATVMHSYC